MAKLVFRLILQKKYWFGDLSQGVEIYQVPPCRSRVRVWSGATPWWFDIFSVLSQVTVALLFSFQDDGNSQWSCWGPSTSRDPPLATHLRDQINSLRASRSRVRDQGQLGKRGQLRRSQFRSLSRLGSVQISRRLTSNSQKRNSVKAPAKSVKNQRRVEPAKSSVIKRRKRGSKRICLRSQPETSSESEIESSSESSSSLSEDQNKRKKK